MLAFSLPCHLQGLTAGPLARVHLGRVSAETELSTWSSFVRCLVCACSVLPIPLLAITLSMRSVVLEDCCVPDDQDVSDFATVPLSWALVCLFGSDMALF